jgi:hypothetical protein
MPRVDFGILIDTEISYCSLRLASLTHLLPAPRPISRLGLRPRLLLPVISTFLRCVLSPVFQCRKSPEAAADPQNLRFAPRSSNRLADQTLYLQPLDGSRFLSSPPNAKPCWKSSAGA